MENENFQEIEIKLEDNIAQKLKAVAYSLNVTPEQLIIHVLEEYTKEVRVSFF